MANNEETNKPVDDTKPIVVDLGGVNQKTSIFTDKESIAELDRVTVTQTSILKEQSSAPSHNSGNFREQFAMYNGDLYANIGTNWTKLSLAELVGGVIGTNLITNDTYVNEDASSTNYGSSITLGVKNQSGQTREQQSLFFANLERLNGTTITSANLYFYVESYSQWTTQDVSAKRILSRWDDLVVTWGSNPSVTSTDQGTVNLADSDTGWNSVDITTIVQGWLDRSFDNFGVVLSNAAVSVSNEQMTITSSNATANKPYIEIV